MSAAAMEGLRQRWLQSWPQALAVWSRFTRLSEPRWCLDKDAVDAEGMSGNFAMIRLADQAVVINLLQAQTSHVEDFALEILAHEIGHHVYCPADLGEHARMLARMRWALPGQEMMAPFVGNLYTDLLVNDRLYRGAGLRIPDVYRTLGGESRNPLWMLYMRIYEILWSLPGGTLVRGKVSETMEGDAYLGSRLVRTYGRQWLDGSGRFAALCLPYLEEAVYTVILYGAWTDMKRAGEGGEVPAGLTSIEADEREGALHPALDAELSGLKPKEQAVKHPPQTVDSNRHATGQARDPFVFGEILRSMGMKLDNHEVTVRYYRELALPYLVHFPSRRMPQVREPLPEGLEPWDIGAALDEVDWLQSVLTSPHIIPGVTTVQRSWGAIEGAEPERRPLDLDLYVDCSGSMPNPQMQLSYPALAGAILSLSALRAGASVQATLWSGARQFETTGDFIRDERQILRVLTGYLGGGTTFPIHILRDTYLNGRRRQRPTHILVLSDEGVTSMYDMDERQNSGAEISAQALAAAGGGGTLVLNLYTGWQRYYPVLTQMETDGWQIYHVDSLNGLVDFARQFSARAYGGKE